MSFTGRDYQGRANAILGEARLKIDGIIGPASRKAIAEACMIRGVKDKRDLFDRGVRGVVWHWTAGANGIIEQERKAYNFLHDAKGNTYDGESTVAEQVMYDWRKGVGASHTKSMNTGWIGESLDVMAGAKENDPSTWTKYPVTWEGIDAMLMHTAEMVQEYDIPVSPWTTLTHAEVQPTLGIRQRHKWDIRVLPGEPKKLLGAQEAGDILRERLRKFL